MSTQRLIYWAPRVLCVAYIIFLSLFALDVFGEYHGWQLAAALLIHLVPSFVLALVLVLAWRWEWIGAVVFCAAALWYSLHTLRHPNWILTIAGPLFVVAGLFYASWLNRPRNAHA